jgi:hypothetical protein
MSGKKQGKIMKKIALTLAAGAVAAAGLTLAPSASADPALAPAPGTYTLNYSSGRGTENVAQDCGPSCWSMSDQGGRFEFRIAGDRWQTDSGMWTVDGVTITNSHGHTATLTPA